MDGDDSTIWQALGDSRSVFDVAGELTAGGGDVVATGFAHRGDDTRIRESMREEAHTLGRGTLEAGLRERIERNEVVLASHLAGDVDQFASVLIGVVDAIEHDVFEGEEIPGGVLKIAVAG